MAYVIVPIALTGLFYLFSVPAVIVALRLERSEVARRFLIAAPICGLICGLISATSSRLVDQCESAGNTQCLDAGWTGLLVLVLGGYLGISLLSAYVVFRD
ncbi:MAG: hypothetical protein GY724_09070 [Actinomycetia bacterium]|nr:hypothetical protein [Actinomycetes bacterium]